MIVSEHAVARYMERAKPYLGEDQARLELRALADLGRPVDKPSWVFTDEDGSGFLEIAPGVVAVTQQGGRIVATVLVEPLDLEARAKRNKVKADRRRAKRDRNRSHTSHARKGPLSNARPAEDWAA